MLRACTVGLPTLSVGRPEFAPPPPRGLPGFNGPYWGNFIVGIFYLVAALYAARTKRQL